MIKIAVCDDDKCQALVIEKMIHKYNWKEDYEVHTYFECEKLMDSIHQGMRYDVLFMDLVFGEDEEESQGTLWAKRMKDINPEMLIVYMSGYAYFYENMVHAEPFDFISKPIFEEKIHNVLNKAMIRLRFYQYHYMFNGQMYTVNLQDVKYMYSVHRKVYIKMVNGTETYFYAKLDDVEKEINEICDFFRRPNKSYLLNMKYSGMISLNYAVVGKEEIKISRKYKEKFLDYKEMKYYFSYFVREKR